MRALLSVLLSLFSDFLSTAKDTLAPPSFQGSCGPPDLPAQPPAPDDTANDAPFVALVCYIPRSDRSESVTEEHAYNRHHSALLTNNHISTRYTTRPA